MYPRYAAILADEMGLGKTMQAITAMRLLLHAGEVTQRAVGLPQAAGDQLAARVCRCGRRKCPLTVIEGDQAQRRWQWQQSDTPVKIANYELLQRDRELVAELGLQFDLVVLDEAQRIKNRAQHHQPVRPRDSRAAAVGR